MRAIIATAFGGPEVLQLAEVDAPTPAPGEVLVDVEVAPVLRLDTMIRAGWARERFGAVPPYTPGGAATGVVSALGDGVDTALLGTRVTADRRGRHGGYAEFVTLPADAVTAIPDGLDIESAAAVQQDGRTAMLLVDLLEPRPAEWVLVTAAAGGAGHLVVQLAAARGARVIAAAGADAKRAFVSMLDVEAVLDYRNPWWIDELVDVTGGAGPQVVFDGAGGDLGYAAYVAMADGGRIVNYGAPGGSFAPIDADGAAGRGIELHGLGSVRFDPAQASALTERALVAAAAGEFTPHIGATFALADAAAAHEHIAARAAIGKTLLRV